MRNLVSMLKRPLALVLAVLLVLSCVNGAVVEVSAAVSGSVMTDQIMVSHFSDMPEKAKELISSDYLSALKEEIAFSKPETGDVTATVSEDGLSITAPVYQDGSNTWVPVRARIEGELGTKNVEFTVTPTALEESYTAQIPGGAGESYEAYVTYGLYVNVSAHIGTLAKALQKFPNEMAADVAQAAGLMDAVAALELLCGDIDKVGLQSTKFNQYSSVVDLLYEMYFVGVDTEDGYSICLAEVDSYGMDAAIGGWVEDQIGANGVLDLIGLVDNYRIGGAFNLFYAMYDQAMVDFATTAETLYNDLDYIICCMGDYPAEGVAAADFERILEILNDAFSNLVIKDSDRASKWYLSSSVSSKPVWQYVAIQEDADFVKINDLIHQIPEKSYSTSIPTSSGKNHLYSGEVTEVLGCKKDSAKILVQSQYVPGGEWDQGLASMELDSKYVYRLAGEVSAEALEEIVSTDSEYVEAVLAKLQNGGAFGTVNDTNYELSWTFEYADGAVDDGGMVLGEGTYTLQITPATFEMANNWGAKTDYRYGEPVVLPIHTDAKKEFTYLVGEKRLYQGDKFQVEGSVEAVQTEYSKAKDMTLGQILIEAGIVTSAEEKVLANDALIVNSYRVRFPNDSELVAPESLVITAGDFSIKVLDFESGVNGLFWLPVSVLADGKELSGESGSGVTTYQASSQFEEAVATYELELGADNGVISMAEAGDLLNLPAELLAEYNAVLTALEEQTVQSQINALDLITPSYLQEVGNTILVAHQTSPTDYETGKDTDAFRAYEKIVAADHLIDKIVEPEGEEPNENDTVPMAYHLLKVDELLGNDDDPSTGDCGAAVAYYYQNRDEIVHSMNVVKENMNIILTDKDVVKEIRKLAEAGNKDPDEIEQTLRDFVNLIPAADVIDSVLAPLNENVDVQSDALVDLMRVLDGTDAGAVGTYSAPSQMVLTAQMDPVAGKGSVAVKVSVTYRGQTKDTQVSFPEGTAIGSSGVASIEAAIEELQAQLGAENSKHYEISVSNYTADSIPDDLTIEVVWTAKEYTVAVGDGSAVVSAENKKITLPGCTESGAYYEYAVCGSDGEAVQTIKVEAEDYVLDMSDEVFDALVTGGKITCEKLESHVHSYDNEVRRAEPACTEPGYVVKACSCGMENTEILDAVGHSYKAVVTDPDCANNGYTTYTCVTCSDAYQDDIVEALGHETVHFDAVEPGCHYNGNVEYWHCTTCEGFWTDEACTKVTNSKSVILPATGGDVVHVEAVAPGCHYEGNVEYWICYECEQVWADEALTQLTNSKNVILPATGSDLLTHMDAVEPGCHYDGNVEYWICYECEQVWTDEALTQVTNIKNVVVPALGGEVVHVDAVEPACHYDGNIEYWYCEDCGQFWQDEALTQLTNSKNVILPATGSDLLTHMDAVEPGCHYEGNVEYWICYECEQVWTDEALTHLSNSKNVILPATGGDVVHVEAVEAACHYDGNIEYWYCEDCGQFWQDEALTQLTNSKNVVVPATGSDLLTHMDAVEPGCHYEGNVEYWICYECEQVWTDEALTQLTNIKNVVLPAVGGNVVHVEVADATCDMDGNIEYWYCESCEQVWQDEALTQLTNSKNVVVPALAHGRLTHMDAVAPGCHYEGNIEYWVCYDCEQVWADEALTQLTNIKNVVQPAVGGEVTHYEAVEPGCHYEGNIEYWVCYDCEQVWADESLTQLTNSKNVVVPATGSDLLVHVDAVEPGCHYEGNVEYWICYECEQVWTDEALTQVSNAKNVILPATGSDLLTHMDAVESGCHYEGNIEYWICYECEQVWTDEALTQVSNIKNVVVPATGGEVTHYEAVAPGCHYEGNVEYWICYECEQVWADEALTQLTNSKNVILPATGSDLLTHMDAVEPGCHYDGNVEYWICYECEQVWTDEALTQVTNIKNVVVPALGGEVVHVDAVEPACHYDGNIEYWYCEDCGQFWQDEALTQLTNSKNVILPATGSDLLTHMDAVEPGCHYEGNVEYWVCYECEQVWTDGALTQVSNSKNVILPAVGGDVVHVAAVEPTCNSEGNIEYWTCEECEQVWQDEALTQLTNIKNVTIGVVNHELVHVDAIEPACHYDGNIEYWRCAECEQVWQDEALTQLTNIKNVVLPAIGGDVTHYEAIEPTCISDGNIEYWRCAECEQVWQDEALTQLTNIKNVVIGVLEHEIVHVDAVEPGCHYDGNIEYWRCAECEQVWQDEALTQLTNIKNVVVSAVGGEVEHFEAVEAGCHYDGNIEYWVCYECEQVWQDEALTQLTNIKNVVLPATGEGDLVHVDAVEPACHYEGNVEYWICHECEQVWTDEALTQVSNIKNVVVPANGGEVVHVDAVEPGCHYDGNIEHWICYECEQVWQDEALTQLTNSKNVVVPAVGGEVEHFEAVAPGCHDDGNIEYWICYECEQVWTDEALTQVSNIKNVVVPATGEGNVVHMEAVAAGCHDEGNIEYWICYTCEKVWQDEALTQLTNSKNVILPATGEGNVVHMEAVAPGCHANGNIEYWICYECEKVWQDESLTQLTNAMNVILPAVGSENVVHFEAVEPGCHSNGNVEYWYCPDCDGFWTDEACTQITNSKSVNLSAVGSENVVHFEAVEPGCDTNGNVEYWYCPDCDGFWTDEACTQLTNSKNVIIGMTGHSYEGVVTAPTCEDQGYTTYTCTVCDDSYEDEYVDATGHNAADPVIENVVYASCKEDGSHDEVVYCAACGKKLSTETVVDPKTDDHNYAQLIERVEPTCAEAGYEIKACGCGEQERTEIPVAEHASVVHQDAVTPGCHYNGNIEYWFCADCEGFWTDEALTKITNSESVILPATGSDLLTHVDAVEPGCHYDGNIEYWICYECEQVWTDEALTQLTNIKNVVVPATGSDLLVHMDAVEAGCHDDGNVEYWVCYECEQVWSDEALTQKTNIKNVVVSAVGGDVTHVEAVEPACHYNGNIEYWYCEECGKVWQDEALTQLTNRMNVILPATGEGDLQHFEAVEAACHYEGNIEYWVCYTCEQVWTDEALTQVSNIKNVVVPATGSDQLVHVDAVESGCHYDGNIEYWICYECEQVWTDEALTQVSNIKNVVVPATGSDQLVHVDAVESGCHYDGNIEYWICYECEQVWTDEALTQVSNIKNVVVPATGSDQLVHVDAVEPGCNDNGNVEHWICYECEQVWTDEALTQVSNIRNVVVPALGHDEVAHEGKTATCTEGGWADYVICSRCDYSTYSAIAALGHKGVIVPAVPATCTSTGLSEGKVCSVCGEILADQTVTEMLEHSFGEWVLTVRPTEETEGEETRTCVCGETEKRTVEKLKPSHVHSYTAAVTEPTCTEGGYTTYSCSCGDSYVADKTEALGHNYVRTVIEPSYSAEGSVTDACSGCGDAKTEMIPALENPFTDVKLEKETEWFYAPVMWALDNNITKGVTATEFGPDGACTRAHVVTFLWRAAGSPEPSSTNNPFVDVKNDAEGSWYYKAVLWAVEKGITKGVTSTTFEPGTTCTRAQIVTFLWRFAGSPEAAVKQENFADVDSVTGSWYYDAVLWAVETGVTTGMSETSFAPDSLCTRAQVVTFLSRAVK